MNSKLLLPIACTLILSSNCKKSESGENTKQEQMKRIHLSLKERETLRQSNFFGIKLFKTLNVSDVNKNIIVSPLSISQALSMAYNGASGETKTEFVNTLNWNNLIDKDINKGNKQLTYELQNADKKIELLTANSIWIKKDFKVYDTFLNTNKEFYNAEVHSFLPNNLGKNMINGWVTSKTNNRITSIIDDPKPNGSLYLINAIYFKGLWKFPFKKDNTSKKAFHLSNGKNIQVPFMQQIKEFRFLEDDEISILEIPYGRGNFHMVFLLPKKKTIDQQIAELSPELLDEWQSKIFSKEVNVTIPKFKLGYGKVLNSPLMDIGLKTPFSYHADFSRISETPLCISEVMHKSFIEINEEGTEATAATSVEMLITSPAPSQPSVFIANKPFIFMVKEKETNAIIFIGKINNPIE